MMAGRYIFKAVDSQSVEYVAISVTSMTIQKTLMLTPPEGGPINCAAYFGNEYRFFNYGGYFGGTSLAFLQWHPYDWPTTHVANISPICNFVLNNTFGNDDATQGIMPNHFADNGTFVIFYSQTLTTVSISIFSPMLQESKYNWGSGAYGNGIFMLVYVASTNLINIAIGTNVVQLATWDVMTFTPGSPNAGECIVVFGGGLFVITLHTAAGIPSEIWSSPDGENWTRKIIPTHTESGIVFTMMEVIYSTKAGMFLATLGSKATTIDIGSTYLASSSDLITWHIQKLPSSAFTPFNWKHMVDIPGMIMFALSEQSSQLLYIK
jgi:hypothetical protein